MQIVKSKLKDNDIVSFLKLCDSSFVPPLSARVDLNVYSKKLATKTEHFCAIIEGQLAGLSCCYCNDQLLKTAFISVLCMHPDFQNIGIGNKLILFLIAGIQQMGFKKVKAEVNKLNAASCHMFKRADFNLIGEDNDPFFMEKVLNE